MRTGKRVRIIKKVREESGRWRFVYLQRKGNRYIWDDRPGTYFLEWWQEGGKRRQTAGQTPSEATEARRRKRNELIGEMVSGGGKVTVEEEQGPGTTITEAKAMFLDHIRVHSPDKPNTLQWPPDSEELITARTINFEVSVLRTFFYFLINERGLKMENPCARFKRLKDSKQKSKRRPPTYSQEELDKLFEASDEFEKTAFATLLLTGFREQELCYLAWPDVNLRQSKKATIRLSGEGKDGFSPQDYEERTIPIPEELSGLLQKLPRTSEWVLPNTKGDRTTHLLRRLKEVAARAGVRNATLHKFRHTYATRLLESGCDIVTVQTLMGHSDLETTRQYLNPDEDLQRQAGNRLSLTG